MSMLMQQTTGLSAKRLVARIESMSPLNAETGHALARKLMVALSHPS